MATRPNLALRSLLPSGRAAVWRLIADQLVDDVKIKTVVDPRRFWSWEGNKTDAIDLPSGPNVSIRLTPGGGEQQWIFNDAQGGPLLIAIETVVPGTCVDDIMNLWSAIETALYPANIAASGATTAQTFQEALVTAGALTGQIRLALPLSIETIEADGSPALRARGQIEIKVRRTLNY